MTWYFHSLLVNNYFAKELRLFHLGDLFRGKYNNLQQSLRKGQLDLSNRRVFAEFFIQGFSTVTVYVTVGLAAYLALRGQITVGDLTMIYLGFQNGLGSLQAVLYGMAELYENNLFLSNFYKFMALKPTIQAPDNPSTMPEQHLAGICFENVTFSYPGCEQPALKDVNLSLAPGEVIALVGENGSGKTTLVKLLCQLYRPSSGQIKLEGISQDFFDPIQWRRQFSVIFQDYAQYFLTAWENIWIGDVKRASATRSQPQQS
jgi:ATP-binding cassette subfamily B protein